VGLSLAIILPVWAVIAQSKKFPETNFEVICFSAFILAAITLVLALIWKTRA